MDIMQEENVMKLTAIDPICFQERKHTISDDVEDSVRLPTHEVILLFITETVRGISNSQQTSSSPPIFN